MSGPLELHIRAIGTPAPKGSLTPIIRGRRAYLIEDNKMTKPWRAQLAAAIANAKRAYEHDWVPLNEPCEVDVTFLMDRTPASRRRLFPCTRPDVDKLARCVLDELQASAVLTEDGRVTDLTVRKRYVREGQRAGAIIVVRSMSDQGALI